MHFGWRARVRLAVLCQMVFLAQRAPLLELALQDQSVTGNCATAVTSFAYAKASVSCYAILAGEQIIVACRHTLALK